MKDIIAAIGYVIGILLISLGAISGTFSIYPIIRKAIETFGETSSVIVFIIAFPIGCLITYYSWKHLFE